MLSGSERLINMRLVAYLVFHALLLSHVTTADDPAGSDGQGSACYPNQQLSCSSNASCIEEDGASYCRCNPGYQGDGFTCDQIDYCGIGAHSCSENAICKNKGNTTECECKPGYEQVNSRCTLIDNCADKPCGESSSVQCFSHLNGYSCVCPTGYQYLAGSCQDVDECSGGSSSCGQNAECVNTKGSFSCECTSGYVKSESGDCLYDTLFHLGGQLSCKKADDESYSVDLGCKAIPFGDQVFSEIKVSSNGYVSFGSGEAGIYPRSDPNAPLIAVFWGDLDSSNAFNDSQVCYSLLNDPNDPTLEVVSQRFAASGVQLKVSTALIVNYIRMRPYPAEWYASETVSAQLVLATDGLRTFALLNYPVTQIKWNSEAHWRPVLVGSTHVTGVDGPHWINQAPPMNETKFGFDKVVGNTGHLGSWRLEVGQLPTDRNHYETCCSWIQNAESLPSNACPPTVQKAELDDDYTRASEQNVTGDKSIVCYNSLFEHQILKGNYYENYTQQCCYSVQDSGSNSGLSFLIPDLPGAGTPYTSDEASSRVKESCMAIGWLQAYQEKRPVSTSLGYSPPASGFVFGDPHFVTADGLEYTFNGIGEYVLSRSVAMATKSAQSYKLHAVARPVSSNKASSITDLALRSGDVDLRWSYDADADDVLVFEKDKQLGSVLKGGENSVSESLAIRFHSQAEGGDRGYILVSLNIGLHVEVSRGYKSLQIRFVHPSGVGSEGLLGNANGKLEDDLGADEGIEITSGTAQSEIFNLAGTWKVSSADSLFAESTVTVDDEFVPVFFDDWNNNDAIVNNLFGGNEELYVAADQVCKIDGATNNPCLYDVALHGSIDAAESVILGLQRFINVKRTIVAAVPIITGAEDSIAQNFTVTSGEIITISFKVSAASATAKVEPVDPTVAEVPGISLLVLESADNTNFILTWTVPAIGDLVAWQVVVYDLQTYEASVWRPIINYCNCINGGDCSFDYLNNRPHIQDKVNVSIGSCSCKTGFFGAFCEKSDLCAQNPAPCFPDAECTVEEGVAKCGACPDGTTRYKDDKKCAFTTPCADQPCADAQCVQSSSNAFQCNCQLGYAYDFATNSCQPINQCVSANSCGPNADCLTSGASHECLCRSGFEKSINGTCDDINECDDDPCDSARTNAFCTNNLGDYRCTCKAGYKRSGLECTDINECETFGSFCEHSCINLQGSYQCGCSHGFELTGRNSCVPINYCTSNVCQQNENCSNLPSGGYKCTKTQTTSDPLTTASTKPANNASITTAVIAESTEIKNTTTPSESTNEPNPTTPSESTNEPNPTTPSESTDKPDPTTPSESTDKPDPTTPSESTDRPDTTASLESTDGFSTTVLVVSTVDLSTTVAVDLTDEPSTTLGTDSTVESSTTVGADSTVQFSTTGVFVSTVTVETSSFAITTGSSVLTDCDKFGLECDINADCIRNEEQKLYCRCKSGYLGDGKTCELIDYCGKGWHNCSINAVCNSTIGGWTCSCRPGYQGNGYNCQWKDPCNPNPCGMGSCRQLQGGMYDCFCDYGYQFNVSSYKCEDRDECLASSSACPAGTECKNTNGSYECRSLTWIDSSTTCVSKPPSKPLAISLGCNAVPFGNKAHNTLYITQHGYVTFDQEYVSSSPTVNPPKNLALVAIWWSQIDWSQGGQLCHSVLTENSSGNSRIFNEVSNRITTYSGRKFTPDTVIIVNYENIRPNSGPASKHETVRAQGVIASDGLVTYVLYNYPVGGVLWNARKISLVVGSPMANVTASNLSKKWITSVPANSQALHDTIFIDTITGNTEVSGSWWQEVGRISGGVNSFAICCRWLQSAVSIPAPNSCPSVYQQVMRDTRYIEHSKTQIKDKLHRICIADRFYFTAYVVNTTLNNFEYLEYKQQCCYPVEIRSSTNIVDKGGLYRQMPDAGTVFTSSAMQYEAYVRDHCIAAKQDSQYIRYRPISLDNNYRPPNSGNGHGDPHFTTLDGAEYTFNGLGEYILTRTSAKNYDGSYPFSVLANTSQVYENSTATVFTAFTIDARNGTTAGDIVTFELTAEDEPIIEVKVNGKIANQSESSWFQFERVKADNQTDNDTYLALTYGSGVQFTIQKGFNRSLQIQLGLPDAYKGKLEGLLGNMDGDSSNDLVDRSGTLYSLENSTQRLLHEFGESWRSDSNPKRTPASKARKDLFIDELNETQMVEEIFNGDSTLFNRSRNSCSSLNSSSTSRYYACMLDSGQMKSVDAGQTVITTVETFDNDMRILRNEPPKFSMPAYLNLAGNQSINMSISVTDDKTNNTLKLTLEFVDPDLENITEFKPLLTNESGWRLVWTVPESADKLRPWKIVAVDEDDGQESWSPDLLFCSCQNNATCSHSQYFDSNNSSVTSVAADSETPTPSQVYIGACECVGDYSGLSCERSPCVIDDSGSSPCFNNSTCTVVNNTATCGKCPDGYEGDGFVCYELLTPCSLYISGTIVPACGDYRCIEYTDYKNYTCDCPRDYHFVPDSRGCVHKDSCDSSSSCSGGKKCINGLCKCPGNMIEDIRNATCVAPGVGPCLIGDICNSTVTNTECKQDDKDESKYQCVCRNGFEAVSGGDHDRRCEVRKNCPAKVGDASCPLCKELPNGYLCECDSLYAFNLTAMVCEPVTYVIQPSDSSPTGPDLGLIIGLSIAAAFLLCVFIVLIMWLVKRKKHKINLNDVEISMDKKDGLTSAPTRSSLVGVKWLSDEQPAADRGASNNAYTVDYDYSQTQF